MTAVIFWSIIFSITTAASIVFLGSRDFVEGQMTLTRVIKIIFDWKFIVGAVLAFGARMLFVMTNNAIYKIPELASSSTTITTLINSAAIILVILANYYFLDEKLNTTQIFGAVLIFAGIFFVTKA